MGTVGILLLTEEGLFEVGCENQGPALSYQYKL